MSADREAGDGADRPVAGDEHGAHAANSAQGAVTVAADDAASDLFAFGQELDQFARHAIRPPVKRGAGRPPGSPNRATSKVREFLLARGYRDPMEHLAAFMTTDLRDLVALGLDPDKAAALQIKAAADLMPYFHQAMPKQVEAKIEQVRHLVVIADGPLEKDQRNQRVVDVTPNASHEVTPVDDGQPIDIAGLFGEREHD